MFGITGWKYPRRHTWQEQGGVGAAAVHKAANDEHDLAG